MTFSVGLGYADATFDSYKDAGGIGIHFDGNRLEYAPKLDLSASILYERRISEFGTALFSLDYSYADELFTDVANNPAFAIDSLGLLGGRLGFSSASEKFQLFVWAKNLNKEIAIQGNSGSSGNVSYTQPRTYGVQLNYLF